MSRANFFADITHAAAYRLVTRMIWEDGSGSAEREIARLEAVGELEGVELHIVHWQTDASAAANELMRKRKATREQVGFGRCRWELCRSAML